MSLIEVDNVEEKRRQALRELTKTFFGIEKPIKGIEIKLNGMSALIKELHTAFSSDSVNIE